MHIAYVACAAHYWLVRLTVEALDRVVALSLTFLFQVEGPGFTDRRRAGHDEGEETGYDGEDSELHGFKYIFVVLITYSANVSIDHEGDQYKG